jgi:hypothetical protein
MRPWSLVEHSLEEWCFPVFRPFALRKAGLAAAYLFLLAAGGWYVAKNFVSIESGLGLPSDFQHYYDAGREILRCHTPYSDELFLYPAILAFATTPFALTTYLTARWIWFLASHLMLLTAAFIIWRRLGGGLAAACPVALVWAGGGAAAESLGLGQIGPLLVLLLTLAYTRTGAGSGLAAGAGAACKFLPGVLVLPLALARDRRAVVSLLMSAAALTFLPMAALSGFEGPKSPGGAVYLLGTPALLSWSVPSTVLRVMDPPESGGRLPQSWEFGNSVSGLHLPLAQRVASASSSLMVLLSGAMVLLWSSRGRLTREQLPIAMAGFLSLSLAAAPLCWTHYQILQYPGVAWLLGLAVQRRRWKVAALILTCGALLYPIPVAVLTHYYHLYGWTAASTWQLYVWMSVTPAACLGIFAMAMFLMRSNVVACEKYFT